jgi:GNAT superfamily N-acetyltransferase
VIREATLADVPRLVDLGIRWIGEGPYAAHITPSAEAMAKLAAGLIEADHGLILVYERAGRILGMIGVIATFHPYSGSPVMSEMFWYVEPESRGVGVRLLRAAEEWGRSHSIVDSIMISPSPKVSAFYERLGYKPLETQFIKAL